MLNFIDGYKTYIAGALAVGTGLVGFFIDAIDNSTAWGFIVAGFSIMGFRDAIKKVEL